MRSHHLIFVLALVVGCGPTTPTPKNAVPEPPPVEHVMKVDVPAAIAALVTAEDRDPDDRKLDEGRHPGELLAFLGITPGTKLGELGAGGGYTTEFLARAVGPTGVIYAQNNKFVLEKFAEAAWSKRLQKPVMKPVIRVDRELEDPFPPEAKNLDAVIFVLFYHDTVWLKTDRAKMNAAVLRALKPGGVYCVVDHTARKGAGVSEAQTLHRIEESVVREEVAAAGFVLKASADFLRAPFDTLDWSASPGSAAERRGTSDRFVLKFVKP